MSSQVYVFDPTIQDTQSKVRGIGRYLQILRENFENEFVFTNNLESSIQNLASVFINPFFNFLAKPLTLKRVAKKQIAVIHDLIPLKYPKHFPIGLKGTLFVQLNKLALKNYDAIITDSFASKKDIIDILRIPEKKIHVIYPCLPKIFTSVIPTTNNQQPATNYCLYVGDATWNKNLVNLAKAIKKVGVPCVFVGKVFSSKPKRLEDIYNDKTASVNGWQKDLQEFFLLTENDPLFIFKGFVSDEELISLYQNAILNVLPSRDEGFGFSYLEASSQHCPSLLSDIPVLREISDTKALFADPNSTDDLSVKMKQLFNGVELRNKLRQESYERSLFFSAQSFATQLRNIVYEI